MDMRLINLQLVLNDLGIGALIDTLDERVTFQKAVYLAQAVGVPLHYRYSWYIMGPYSRDLTRDYYALHEYPHDEAATATQQEMREPFASALRKLKAAMDAPQDVHLDKRDWLELLSSVHFLRTTVGLDPVATQARLDVDKSSLSRYVCQATQSLAGLIPS